MSRRILFYCLILISSLIGTLNSYAIFDPQKLYIKNVNLNDGLSQIVVTDLAIGNFGYVWASTFDGLNRFDGSSIKVFRHLPSDDNSISSSNITKLYADQNQHLYLETTAGFGIFDCITERIMHPDFLKMYSPQWITNNAKNEIWVYTQKNELLLVNTNGFNIVKRIDKSTSMPLTCDLLDMVKIDNYLYIISVCGEVIRYDISKNIFFKYPLEKNIINKFQSIGVDKDNNIFILSAWNDYYYFNTKLGKFDKPIFYQQNKKLVGINRVLYDSKRNVLFVSTYGQGLFVYDYTYGTFNQYKKGESKFALSSNYILSILLAPNGMIYLGYDGIGFDAIDPFVKKFTSITIESEDDTKSLKFVRKIQEDDDGNLLIGTAGSGLIKYNVKTEESAFLPIYNEVTGANNFVIELLKVGNELWLGYNGNGIGIIDLKTKKLVKWIKDGENDNEIRNGTIWSFIDDGLGNIWAGTRANGINIINKQTKLIKKITPELYPEFVENGIRTMILSKSKKVLVGTEKGLYEIDPITLKSIKLFPKNNDVRYNSFQSIKTIYQDNKNRTWLGTFGGGIAVLSPTYDLIKNLNTDNYLLNNVVYAILPENDTTIWISSNFGISKIIHNEKSFTKDGRFTVNHFDEINGLQSKEFNTGAYLKLKNGQLVFGGSNGINMFNPYEITSNSYLPKVYISEFKIFENNYKTDTNIAFLKKVNLKHYENAISIGFNTLGFTLPGKTNYQYRLIGYDTHWINADNRNYVSYTNLNYGNYEFQVRASTNKGEWGDTYTKLKIEIETPFYRTWWFIISMSLLVIGFAYMIFRIRTKQMQEKEATRVQYNKELAEVEMKALRAQINPHFLFNSLNSINNFILKNETNKASKYLVKFSQLVRNILNNSSSSSISLQEELETIELYMLIEGMRFNNQFSYQIKIDEEVNTSVIKIPSLLIQPYIENAIWHGLLQKEGEKKIEINITIYNEEAIAISIIDNGIGRDAARALDQRPKNHKSFGMQIGENRIRLMNSGGHKIAKLEVIDLYNEQHIGIGTKIVIIIPSN